jgi:YggT family protein
MIFVANFILAVMRIVHLAMMVYVWIVIIRSFLSWIPMPSPSLYPLAGLLVKLTEPVLKPIRKLLPPYKTGGLDLSPMILIFFLLFLDSFLFKSVSLYAAQMLRRATGGF